MSETSRNSSRRGARVRRDIWSLEEEQRWHPITRAYALAVAEMQSRADSDPTSWTYQAQVHGMPDGGQPDDFRGQCQHQTWFFLSWHRLYLHWFERVVQACVEANASIDDEVRAGWALPYWNYSPGGTRATLPAAFRDATMPDGSPNPLFVADRNDFVNDGEELDPRAVLIDRALTPTVFSRPRPDGGFGGAETGWNHLNQDVRRMPGSLEQTPHGSVHMEVGGLMARFATAGLDPVFWLHHANIDRLWESWRLELGRPDPDVTSAWGTTRFRFHDEKGNQTSGTAADVLDTATDLDYTYEDITVPAPTRRGRRGRVQPPSASDDSVTGRSEGTPAGDDGPPAELVGATEDAVELSGGTQDVSFRIDRPGGPAADQRDAAPGRVILTVEGIESVDPGRPADVTYAVYLNPPGDEDADADPEEFFVGTLDFFGLEEVGGLGSDTAGHDLRRSFDVTDLVEGLREEGRWDPESVTISFRPLRRGRRRAADDAQREVRAVRVGRVGLFVE
jgi:tyrosinase